MPSESGTSVRLQIGHVLFMDLVAYSTQLLDEQRQYQEQLNEIVRGTEQVRSAKEAGKLIRLPAGDGMALVFFDSPEAPVRCAIEISKKLKEYPQLKLRMGIHSGPIDEVRDVNDRINVAGAGINLARRVMDWGDGGPYPAVQKSGRGSCATRDNGVAICMTWENAPESTAFPSSWSISTETVSEIPNCRKRFGKRGLEQAAKAAATGAPRRFRRVYLAIAATVVSIGVIGLCLWFYWRQNQASSYLRRKASRCCRSRTSVRQKTMRFSRTAFRMTS